MRSTSSGKKKSARPAARSAKAATKKAAAKKTANKKTASKKSVAKKTVAKKAAPPARKAAVTKKKAASSRSQAAAPRTAKKINKEYLLQDLFFNELKDVYWAEKHLTKVLPKMEKAATSDKLKKAFATHLQQTMGQIKRLEQAFEMLGEKAQAKKCDAMAGITREGDEIISDTKKGTETRDVGLILAAQKVEHYEIATYGSLVTIAHTINKRDVANLLAQTLKEEKETDALLTELATSGVNEDATGETEDNTEKESEGIMASIGEMLQ
ncbi:MAG: ferritin-like domain-containing protein [Bacteroidetes bacterium]|nr:ferritin-like domain-containing protein [Bacteroidota bacterium]